MSTRLSRRVLFIQVMFKCVEMMFAQEVRKLRFRAVFDRMKLATAIAPVTSNALVQTKAHCLNTVDSATQIEAMNFSHSMAV